MSQKKSSKEELYLMKLYEFATAKGDPQTQMDRYEVGKALGAHDKAVDNIIQLLTKNNLTKKTDEKMVHLTDFGLRFVKQYLFS